MSSCVPRKCPCLLAVALLAFLTVGTTAVHAAPLSGSYHVVQKTDAGARIRVRLQLHLINHELHELRIQRLTFWDVSHPDQRGSQACAILLRAGAAADVEQEFSISRTEYELWRRGSRPRVVLELRTANGSRASQVVHLGRTSDGRMN
jgi:hypothetical protein